MGRFILWPIQIHSFLKTIPINELLSLFTFNLLINDKFYMKISRF